MGNDSYISGQSMRASQRGRGGSARLIVGAILAAFLAGAALMGWFAWENGMRLFGTGVSDTVGQEGERGSGGDLAALAEPSAEPAPGSTGQGEAAKAAQQASQAARKVERVAQQTGGLDQRLAALEQRIARLDLQAQAASGNAARAEGLLIAFAARRRIERGEKLDQLADQIRLRFGDARPNAVKIILETGEKPITLDQLIAQLDLLAPQLASPPVEDEGFAWFTRQLKELFVVRHETGASPLPARRLERARLFLESGRIEDAITEVRHLPGAGQAETWIADATRYAQALQALDLLETTAVLEPFDLRDGEGKKVQQPSPAG